MNLRWTHRKIAVGTAALGSMIAAMPCAFAQGAPADIPAMTLKVSHSFPPVGFVPDRFKEWTENITKRTDGKVKFQIFWSESLFKQTDAAPNLAAGVADFSNVSSTYDPAKTALWMTLDMPFNARDYWCGITASVQTQQDEPNLRKTFDQLGFLPITGYASGHFHFLSNKPIEKLADLQKKRIRSYGGARIKMYEPLGISPIFMPYGQIYEAVERGVVDGAEGTVLLTDSFKHFEIAKFMTATNSGMALAAPVSVSLKRWNSFPASLKKIVLDASIEHNMTFARGMIEQETVKLKEFVDKRGMRLIKLSAADQAALEKAGKDAQEQWLADMDKKNVPARATWAKFQELQTACEREIAAKGYPWQQKK